MSLLCIQFYSKDWFEICYINHFQLAGALQIFRILWVNEGINFKKSKVSQKLNPIDIPSSKGIPCFICFRPWVHHKVSIEDEWMNVLVHCVSVEAQIMNWLQFNLNATADIRKMWDWVSGNLRTTQKVRTNKNFFPADEFCDCWFSALFWPAEKPKNLLLLYLHLIH